MDIQFLKYLPQGHKDLLTYRFLSFDVKALRRFYIMVDRVVLANGGKMAIFRGKITNHDIDIDNEKIKSMVNYRFDINDDVRIGIKDGVNFGIKPNEIINTINVIDNRESIELLCEMANISHDDVMAVVYRTVSETPIKLKQYKVSYLSSMSVNGVDLLHINLWAKDKHEVKKKFNMLFSDECNTLKSVEVINES